MLYTATYSSPLRNILIESDGNALRGLRFVDKADISKADGLTDTRKDTTQTHVEVVRETDSNANANSVFVEVRQWLEDYFGGKQPCNVPRLNPQGTDFQRRVWQALFTIPYWETKTYGEIARIVGCSSARAVGQAVGHNPIVLIIPCHRVIAANGTLGGYAYGADRKKRLLELESKKLKTL